MFFNIDRFSIKNTAAKTIWSCGGVFITLILLYTEFLEKFTKRTREFNDEKKDRTMPYALTCQICVYPRFCVPVPLHQESWHHPDVNVLNPF